MDTAVLVNEVVTPSSVKVAVADQRAEPEHGLDAGQSPARARNVEAVAAERVATGALDGAGGNRPASGERGVVAELVEPTVLTDDPLRRLPPHGQCEHPKSRSHQP
ncbi:hypothetical protein GCM10010219_40950 [Streptomyces netropsis]|nr:hypothetical protein GCM10010219_40950 [Streptomyces netropsis]